MSTGYWHHMLESIFPVKYYNFLSIIIYIFPPRTPSSCIYLVVFHKMQSLWNVFKGCFGWMCMNSCWFMCVMCAVIIVPPNSQRPYHRSTPSDATPGSLLWQGGQWYDVCWHTRSVQWSDSQSGHMSQILWYLW